MKKSIVGGCVCFDTFNDPFDLDRYGGLPLLSISCEVAIVGAGPAGTTAGLLLARNGVDTVLLEKEDLPRHKTCGGGLTDKTIRLLDRVLQRDPKSLEKKGILNFSSRNVRLGFSDRDLGSCTLRDPLYFTDRASYDHYLLQQAASAGLRVRTNERMVELNLPGASLRTGSGETVEYEYLLAADGVHSPTRRTLLDENSLSIPHWDDQMAIGIEAYIPRKQAPEDYRNTQQVELHLGVVNWGYGWVFPHQDFLLVGIAGLQTENDDVRNDLIQYGTLLGFDLCNVTLKGHPIPFGNYVKHPYHENILLLGDAGGFVDPLTGEGIFYAQRTGELAARAYLEDGPLETGPRYGRLVREHVLPELSGGWRLRPLVYAGPDKFRRYLLTGITRGINPRKAFSMVHGRRLWRDFSSNGSAMHDSINHLTF